ncbi:cytochrome P450 6a8-like [Chironomus tepperi]|uniref:cytochrome P450 6a8-like n=1 Tax=Chironomus tepperi TaxID=113505 RepID=UPI00391FB4FE
MFWTVYTIISILILLISFIYLFFKNKYSYFEDQGIPHIKPKFPLGNLQGIGSKFHLSDITRQVYEKFKHEAKIVGFYNFVQPIYLVTDIETVKVITVKDFNNFVNRGFFVNEENEPLSGHLFALEDDRWRFLRNKLSPVFTSGKLKLMFHTISKLGDKFITKVEEKSKISSFDLKDAASRYTVDIISTVAFGMESNTLNYEHQELIDVFSEFNGPPDSRKMFTFFFMMAFPKLAKALKLRQFSKKVSDFFTNVVGGNIKYREDNDDNRSDFLNMLIQLKNKGSIDGEISTESKKLTLNEVLAQAILFFLAGSDTSSSAICFTLTELAFNQDVQDKLRLEIMEKIKNTNWELTYENLHEMNYLNQIINETLRMYTQGVMVLRKAKEDFQVPDSNIVIKKGSSVWIPTLAFHFDDRFWENPTKFDPERFTQEEIAKRPSFCYFPFGEGPRNCIGMRFGLVNAKFGVASIIKNFKVTPDARMKHPIVMNPKVPHLEPKDGFWLNFEKI